jgi:hypothetical protein
MTAKQKQVVWGSTRIVYRRSVCGKYAVAEMPAGIFHVVPWGEFPEKAKEIDLCRFTAVDSKTGKPVKPKPLTMSGL